MNYKCEVRGCARRNKLHVSSDVCGFNLNTKIYYYTRLQPGIAPTIVFHIPRTYCPTIENKPR